jgi:hypothetical protein
MTQGNEAILLDAAVYTQGFAAPLAAGAATKADATASGSDSQGLHEVRTFSIRL